MTATTKTKTKNSDLDTSDQRINKAVDKRVARSQLLQKLGFAKNSHKPLVGLVTKHMEQDIASDLRVACRYLPLHLVAIEDDRQADFLALDIVVFGADSLDQGHAEVLAVLKSGAVPVIYEKIAPKYAASDYDPLEESGNSFFFTQESIWSVFAALTRAVETHRFPHDWSGIVRNALQAGRVEKTLS